MAERRPLQLKPVESFAVDDASGTYDPKTRTRPFRWLSQLQHVRMDFWGERFLLILHPEGCSLSRVNAGGPFMFLHPDRTCQVIGNVVADSMTLSAEGDGLGMTHFIDFAEDESDTVEDRRNAMKVAHGYLKPVSMDAILLTTEIREFPDEPGRMTEVHAMTWEVCAVSAVPIAQDPGALMMGAQTEVSPMSTKNAPDAAAPDAAPVVQAPDAVALAAATKAGEATGNKAAFARMADCREIGTVFGMDEAAILKMAEGTESIADISKRLIKAKADAGDALNLHSQIRVGQDEVDTLKMAVLGGIEASLGHTKPTGPAARFEGSSLESIARVYLHGMRFADVSFDPLTAPTHMVVRRALGFGMGGALAPTDLPILLVGGVQRVLNRIATEAPPMDWLQLCKQKQCNDLREIQLVSRTFAGQIQEIPVNGAVEKPFVKGEAYETGGVKQWGGRDDVGRAAQLNDDLGALDDLPQDILQAFREHMYARFWSVFLAGTLRDGKTVCHADHNNVVASGGAGPGTLAQLAKMRKLFAAAKFGEKPLRLRMTHLVVPTALYDEAWQTTSGMITAAEANKTIPPDYRQLTVLSDIALDGASEKIWYAASAQFPSFHYLTLRGQDVPQITQKLDDDTRALQIRAFYDYNIVPTGYQGIARNKGEN